MDAQIEAHRRRCLRRPVERLVRLSFEQREQAVQNE